MTKIFGKVAEHAGIRAPFERRPGVDDAPVGPECVKSIVSLLSTSREVAVQRLIESSVAPSLTNEAWDLLQGYVLEDAAKRQPAAKALDGPAPAVSLEQVAAKKASLAERVHALFDDPDVRFSLIDPNMLRPEAYQRFVNSITSTPMYRNHHREVAAQLKAEILQIMSDTETKGTVVDSSNAYGTHLHLFTTKLWELVQESARDLGAINHTGGPTETQLKVLSAAQPNAHVYGFWMDKQRVHVYSAMVEVFFDNEKGDWINENAKRYVKSVILHELMHIKESPAEWRAWFGALVEASGLLQGHEDGPKFTAAQKQQLIGKGMKLASDFSAHVGCSQACCSTGFFDFVAKDDLRNVAKKIAAKLQLTPELATQTLLSALGTNLDKHPDIERDASGKPTRFGVAQAIFADSFQLVRAGEIAADRGPHVVFGTHEPTAMVDMLLGTATDFNSFADSDEEKRAFMARLEKMGYRDWVRKQSEEMASSAQNFSLQKLLDDLYCITHPPTLPRVEMGAQYMDRFINPESYALLVKDTMALSDPAEKLVEILRVLEKAKHDAVTRFVDPRGFEKADATARVMQGILYRPDADGWDAAINRALCLFDDLLSDRDLRSAKSKVYDTVLKNLSPNEPTDMLVGAWFGVPMERVTRYLIERLECAIVGSSDATREVVQGRLDTLWKLHKNQLEKARAVYDPEYVPNLLD